MFAKISLIFCLFLSYFYENNSIRVSKINQLNNLLKITDTNIAEIWPINRFPIIYRLIDALLPTLVENSNFLCSCLLTFLENNITTQSTLLVLTSLQPFVGQHL